MRTSRTVLAVATWTGSLLVGCASETDKLKEIPASAVQPAAAPAGVPAGRGPHGGVIVKLKSAHCEAVVEPDGLLTLYLLKDDDKTSLPLENCTAIVNLKFGRPVDPQIDPLEMSPMPLDGESEKMTSRFRSKLELPDPVRDLNGRARAQKASITLTQGGDPETVDVEIQY